MTVTRRRVAVLVIGALMTSVVLFAGFSASGTAVPDAHAAKVGGAE